MQRMLPSNIEAECAVLGSILIDPEAIVNVIDFLWPDDFYRDAHRLIYEAILTIYRQHQPADFITLTDELERRNHLADVGGPGYITSLINTVPTSGNIVYYARIVERTGVLRRLIHVAGDIAGMAYEAPEENADMTLEQAEELLFAVRQSHLLGKSKSPLIRDALTAFMERLDQLSQRRGTLSGMPTGFTDLDRLLGRVGSILAVGPAFLLQHFLILPLCPFPRCVFHRYVGSQGSLLLSSGENETQRKASREVSVRPQTAASTTAAMQQRVKMASCLQWTC